MRIPDECFALNNRTINPKTGIGEVIKIKALETGFYPTSMKMTQEQVDATNEELCIDKATARAMHDASMFGWNIYKNALEHMQEFYKRGETGDDHTNPTP